MDNQPEPAANTKHKWLWPAVIVTIVIIGGASLIFWQKNKPKPVAPVVPPPVVIVPAANTVSIINMAFSPNPLTVKKGATVIWTNNDAVTHTVTESDNQTGPVSMTIAPGENYRFTFTTVGTFSYHCTVHTSMTGVVTVTD